MSSQRPSLLGRALLGALVILLFGGAALLMYGRGLSGDLYHDDLAHMAGAKEVREQGFSREVIEREVFRLPRTSTGYVRAMPLLWDSVDYYLYGEDVRGWHASTLAFHVLAALLLIRLAVAAGLSTGAGVAAGSLFLVYPVAGIVATWITMREESVAACFYIAALWALISALAGERLRFGRLGAAWILTLLALFSKETALALPAVATVLLWVRFGLHKRVLLALSGPWLALGFSIWWRFRIFGGLFNPPMSNRSDMFKPAEGIAELGKLAHAYLERLPWLLGSQLVPVAPGYPPEGVPGLSNARVLALAAGGIVVLVVLATRVPWRGSPAAATRLRVLCGAALALPASQVPVSHILTDPDTLPLEVYETWSYYLPAVLSCLFIATLLDALWSAPAGRSGAAARRMRVGSAAAVALLFSCYAAGARGWAERYVRMGRIAEQAAQELLAAHGLEMAGARIFMLEPSGRRKSAAVVERARMSIAPMFSVGAETRFDSARTLRPIPASALGDSILIFDLRDERWVALHDELGMRIAARDSVAVEPMELCPEPIPDCRHCWTAATELDHPWAYRILRLRLRSWPRPDAPPEQGLDPIAVTLRWFDGPIDRHLDLDRAALRPGQVETVDLALVNSLHWNLRDRISEARLVVQCHGEFEVEIESASLLP